MKLRTSHPWLWSTALVAAPLALASCENDVAVHLLRPAPPAPSSTTTAEPTPMPSASTPEPEPEPCVDGDPCSGRYWALSFAGAYDRVEIPSSTLLDLPQNFAIEAWVFVRSYDGGHSVLNRWVSALGDIQLTFGTPEPLPQLELPTLEVVPSHVLASWSFVRTDYWLTVVAPSLPSINNWHHLATSYGAGQYRLYVDGVLAASVAGTDPVPNPQSTLFIGATARHEGAFDPALGTRYWPPVDGFISDVRLSSFDRYSADFTPEAALSADDETLALWHLDEGKGTTAKDSGRSGLEGAIVGATWALAPRR